MWRDLESWQGIGYQWHHAPDCPEDWHIEADNILIDLIGDDEVRELFEKIEKWYS